MPYWLCIHLNHLADFHSYVECQKTVDETFAEPDKWARMCVMNIANMGKFSSDRTILEYARDVWDLVPCHVELPQGNGALAQ